MAEVVYRIQDSNGRGPWKPGFSHVWVEDRCDLVNLRPIVIDFPDIETKFIRGHESRNRLQRPRTVKTVVQAERIYCLAELWL